MPAVSLFSGAGGLDYGLLSSRRFHTEAFLEKDRAACNTLQANFDGRVVAEDIRDLQPRAFLRLGDLRPGDDYLLVAGPPCTPWSKAGFWLDLEQLGPGHMDALLLDEFLRFLRLGRPRAFLFENVWGLTYTNHRAVLDRLLRSISRAGYRCWSQVINAADFGVPQLRHRLIIVGSRDRAAGFVFPRGSYGTSARPHRTASQAIGHLVNRADLAESDEVMMGKWRALLPLVPPGDNYLFFTRRRGHPKPRFEWRSKYWSFLLKLDPDRPSWTIAAQAGPNTGPFHWQSRRLRLGERKLLQGFPYRYHVIGTPREQRRQVGNAVPPPLAANVARAIAEQLF